MKRAAIRHLLTATSLAIQVVGLTLATLPAALTVLLWERYGPPSVALFVLFLPLLYVIWLIGALFVFFLVCGPIWKRFPKLKYIDSAKGWGSVVTLMVTFTSYALQGFLSALPLIHSFTRMPILQRLVWRAYSARVNVRGNCYCFGWILDPDLTELGDEVLIGSDARIVAHAAFMAGPRRVVYVSAPIRIGDRVTIGGGARVSMATIVEDDAMIEPESYLGAYSHVGPGEVWGGNPAKFLHMRRGFGDRQPSELTETRFKPPRETTEKVSSNPSSTTRPSDPARFA